MTNPNPSQDRVEELPGPGCNNPVEGTPPLTELKEWAFEKSRVHHQLAHEDEHLRTEHIASSVAYRELALEIERREALARIGGS